MDVLCVIGRQLSLQQEQEQNPKLSMDAKIPIKTRLKSNGTKIIGKSSAQKNIHPEVADIVKIILTMRPVLLNRHNNISDFTYHLFDRYLFMFFLSLFSFWSNNNLSHLWCTILQKCDWNGLLMLRTNIFKEFYNYTWNWIPHLKLMTIAKNIINEFVLHVKTKRMMSIWSSHFGILVFGCFLATSCQNVM